MKKINPTQELYLKLMELSSFNNFDGEEVVTYLRDHTDEWEACMFIRLNDLITLRDLPDDCNNADTLYVLTKEPNIFLDLASQWNADERSTIPKEKANSLLGGGMGSGNVLVRIWWD